MTIFLFFYTYVMYPIGNFTGACNLKLNPMFFSFLVDFFCSVKKFEQISDEAVGHIAGDLIFTIHQIPHPEFSRTGDDLRINMEINLLDALVGFVKTIKHLDGHDVEVKKSDVSYCSEVVKIPGQGMPRKNQQGGRSAAKSFGDLYVTLLINFPRTVSEAQKTTLRRVLGPQQLSK